MNFARYFEEEPASLRVPVVGPQTAGALSMRLMLEPGTVQELVAQLKGTNPAIVDTLDQTSEGFDTRSLIAGAAIALELLASQAAHDEEGEMAKNAVFVDKTLGEMSNDLPVQSNTLLHVREGLLAALNMRDVEVVKVALALDRSLDDLVALALSPKDKLYDEYQQYLGIHKGDRKMAVWRLRASLAHRFFRLNYLREHTSPGSADVGAAKKHSDYRNGDTLVMRVMHKRPGPKQ